MNQTLAKRERLRPTTVLVVVLVVAIALLLGVTSYLAFLNGDLNIFASQFGPDLVNLGLTPVGAVIVLRGEDRRNPIGWLLLLGSLVGGIQGFGLEYAVHGLMAAHMLPFTAWAAWLQNWIIDILFPCGLLLFVVLLFPTGRPPSRRWRVLGYAGVAVTALSLLNAIPSDYPIQVAPGLREIVSPIAIKGYSATFLGSLWVVWRASIVLLLIAGVSLVVRYRRSAGEERLQIKWFAFAVAITVFAYGAVTPFTDPSGPIPNLIILAGFGVALPLACAISILKYRLYGIDVVISRTLVYGSLAVLITGVYVGIAVGFGELVGSGGKPNLGLSILATAIVAVGFQPARERLQKLANRLVYGKRATPYQVLSQFSSQVAGSYAADEVLPRMARVLEEGTGAERSTVWLRSTGALHPAATWPVAEGVEPAPPVPMANGALPAIPGVTRAVEVRYQGEILGALSVVKRRGEALTPVEEKLLDDLAHQAGLVLKNVGLTADLQRRLEELRASRQRLVSAQNEERRRLERNLHDGAQQHLVALKVKLGLAEMLAAKDPAKARATLQQLKADTDEALETLRDLARGIYPPLLAEKGLATALQSQARKATLPVEVDAENIGRYPQELEATVYFCVLEALQNVQKYAQATRACVRLLEADGELRFSVEDDGRGFDIEHMKMGSGLTNMRDRLDASGGTMTMHSMAGVGTTVFGVLFVPATAMAVPQTA